MAVDFQKLVDFIVEQECTASPGSEQAQIYREDVTKELFKRYWRGTVAVAVNDIVKEIENVDTQFND